MLEAEERSRDAMRKRSPLSLALRKSLVTLRIKNLLRCVSRRLQIVSEEVENELLKDGALDKLGEEREIGDGQWEMRSFRSEQFFKTGGMQAVRSGWGGNR